MPILFTSTLILVLGVLAISILAAACSRESPVPAEDGAENLLAINEIGEPDWASRKDQKNSKADEYLRQTAKRLLVDPFVEGGRDLDGTLAEYAIRLRGKSLSPEEEAAVTVLLGIYRNAAADLARWGFISKRTRNLLAGISL